MEPLSNIQFTGGPHLTNTGRLLLGNVSVDQNLSKYTIFISELVILNCLLSYLLTSIFNCAIHYIVAEQIL